MPCIASNQWVEVPSGELSVHPGSFGEALAARRKVKFPQKSCRRTAKDQAATKVNPEVASKIENGNADSVVRWGRLKDPSVTKTDKLVWIVFRGGRGGMVRRLDEGARDTRRSTER